MIEGVLAWACFIAAMIPAALFWRNLPLYQKRFASGPQDHPRVLPPISVLIPARNEEDNVEDCLRRVLSSREVELEVIVLNDDSQDATEQIVRDYAEKNPRVRLHNALPLPEGWCGKQHACAELARLAQYEWMVFLDSDVRLHETALSTAMHEMIARDVDLLSGIPGQICKSFGEKLLIPLIHFVLLGYLPFQRMRESTDPSYGAGCGQFMLCRKEGYLRAGGHAAIRASRHDGLKLPRAFRQAGLRTDLLDLTTLAECRMYGSGREVWKGLAKNATEGLGSTGLIVPATLLLGLGQVAPTPWLLAEIFRGGSDLVVPLSLAAILSYVPRALAIIPLRQSILSALLHPLGCTLLLVIQWEALLRQITGKPVAWKGR